jgi:hypothetical protein
VNDAELDDRIRQLIAKVVEDAPASPPFPFNPSVDGVGHGPRYVTLPQAVFDIDSGRRRRWWIAAAAAAVVVVALAASLMAGRSDPSPTIDTPPGISPALKDACGNDLSAVMSRVTGLDVATGSIRWTTLVPAARNLVTESPGEIRAVADYETGNDTVIVVASGQVVTTAPRQPTPQMGVDVNSGSLLYGDQVIPPAVTVNGTTIQTNQTTGIEPDKVIVQGQDQAGHVVWRTVLEGDSARTGVGRPVAFGDTVVVSVTSGIPPCSHEIG